MVLSRSPFHLTRRGWGEFPVRVQLHFRDGVTKSIDIIHKLTVCCMQPFHLTVVFGLMLYTLSQETIFDQGSDFQISLSGAQGGAVCTN